MLFLTYMRLQFNGFPMVSCLFEPRLNQSNNSDYQPCDFPRKISSETGIKPFQIVRSNLNFSLLFLLTITFGVSMHAWADIANTNRNPISKILSDWSIRKRDAGIVSYRYTGSTTWPIGAFNYLLQPNELLTTNSEENLPKLETKGVLSLTATLDFRNSRCRIDCVEEKFEPFMRIVSRWHLLTAGHDLVRATQILEKADVDKQKKVDFTIMKGEKQPEYILNKGYNAPLLFGSGVVPTKNQRVKEIAMSPENDQNAFIFTGYLEEPGRTLAVLRVDAFETYKQTNYYWVDLASDSAIVKYVEKNGDSQHTMHIDYDLTDGFWMPKRWTRYFEPSPGTTNFVQTIEVSEFKRLASVSSEDFILHPTNGMYVKEYDYTVAPTAGGPVVIETGYRLNADGSMGEKFTEIKRSEINPTVGTQFPPKRSPTAARLLIVLFAVLPVVFACIHYFRKKRIADDENNKAG